MRKKAVLLANLGSPEQPDLSSVRTYLDQFLMDPYVIQLPWLLRRLIVSLLVLPSRPKASAAAYQSVWLEQGSPLIVLSEQLKQALQQQVDIPVAMAMRYGYPSIESELLKLHKQGIDEVLFIPLYPHFAESTVTTSIKEAERVINKNKLDIALTVMPPFYKQPDYIQALVSSAQPYLDGDFDHIVFSYHGLPESHITKFDKPNTHFIEDEDCCQRQESQTRCYLHQVLQTTRYFVEKTTLTEQQYSIAFQSRLGRAKWLGPNTEQRLQELAHSGAKKVLVICPAFVTDCLETLEEIAIRGEEVFLEAGGESLTLIPCLNDQPEWVSTLATWCQK
ncbi:ferrochelatase [Methylophaga sp. 42_8_T64]|nr:ferrochelatase [Methylophaga sp. 41_12_T18]OUR89490.1 ferrochelatase [Methylophaga sp. 42_8_T64]